jgi:hypothetical protein
VKEKTMKKRVKVEFNKPLPAGAGAKNKFTDAVSALAEAPIGASVFVAHGAANHGAVFAALNMVGQKWATTRKVSEGGVLGIRIWKLSEPPRANSRKGRT